MKFSRFRSMYLDQIMENEVLNSRIKVAEIGTSFHVELPEPVYGDAVADIPAIGINRMIDSWDSDGYFARPPCVYLIKDCIVYTAYGLLTIDDCISSESTSHFPNYLFEETIRVNHYNNSEIFWSIKDVDLSFRTSFAISCNYGINDNYYHWLILFLPRLCSELLEIGVKNLCGISPTIIFPPLTEPFQLDSANAMSKSLKLSYIVPEKFSRIAVDELIYAMPERAIGLTPHPLIRNTLRRLRDELFDPEYPGADRVFITRRDTTNRRISNETELESALSEYGFRAVALSELSLQEQISLFAKAEIIVGQHGAGLTNICFCRPGSRLLELHNPSHQNWCYRRLAGIFSVGYGFIFGQELNSLPDIHINSVIMSIDIEKVRSAVKEMIK